MDQESNFYAVLFGFEDVAGDVVRGYVIEIGQDRCHGFPDIGGAEKFAGVGEIPTPF